jgi:hypothetical protein
MTTNVHSDIVLLRVDIMYWRSDLLPVLAERGGGCCSRLNCSLAAVLLQLELTVQDIKLCLWRQPSENRERVARTAPNSKPE